MSDQRRLAAILVADVVGYSKLVGSDEAGTLARLQTLRAGVIEPAVAKHAGRLFKAVADLATYQRARFFCLCFHRLPKTDYKHSPVAKQEWQPKSMA